MAQYQPEQWRQCDDFVGDSGVRTQRDNFKPDIRDQSRLLELLGMINYKILTGNKVYIEAGGVVYKTLYGAYWRSVFTNIEHYLLKCEEISGSMWAEDEATPVVDLPIAYSNGGWTAGGCSLSLICYEMGPPKRSI
ncbi:MAG TPA: hypothetical protein VFH31_15555 [Pyrinomonadaceae bacterium]|nr:hypothetical protein [Pyrinomonadaceae bacterium]